MHENRNDWDDVINFIGGNMHNFHAGRLSCLIVAIVATLGFSRPVTGGDKIVWHIQTFEHKEKAGGGGREVMWRDLFSLEGYELYDYAVEVDSVRGEGSEFVTTCVDTEGKLIQHYSGANVSSLTDKLKEEINKVKSGGVGFLLMNDETLKITGRTVAGTGLGDSGGNVKYTISGLFIRTAHIREIPDRFAAAAARNGNGDRKLEERQIDGNANSHIEQLRRLDPDRNQLNSLKDRKNELKTALQKLSPLELGVALGDIDAETLKVGIIELDGDHLQNAVDRMDMKTLRFAMDKVDEKTLKAILARLAPGKREAVFPDLEQSTRDAANKAKADWRKK